MYLTIGVAALAVAGYVGYSYLNQPTEYSLPADTGNQWGI
jgi:hypothetical protein